MKKAKLIISFILAIILSLSDLSPALLTSARSVQPDGSNETMQMSNSDIQVSGTNSVGAMLSNVITAEQEEQAENSGYNVFSVEVTGNMATVSLETMQDATVIVAIYDEEGTQMLASGDLDVTEEDEVVTVEIETDDMPEYFFVRAFLIDTDTYRPLCSACSSPNYTREMQKFFQKTVDDFDEEKVVNFDDDATNNFAVLEDTVKTIKQEDNTNEVTLADEEAKNYVIENADGTVTSLQPGDIFVHENGDDDLLIVKVSAIEVVGTTATVTGEETSLEEVFAFVRIESESATQDAVVDDSALEDGVTFEGLVQDVEEPSTGISSARGVEFEEKTGNSLSYSLYEKKIGTSPSVKVSGDIKLKLENSLKVYISFSYQYVELKFDYSLAVGISVEGKGKGSISLGAIGFMPMPGVIIELTPAFLLEVGGKIDASAKIKGSVGFSVSSDEGIKNLTATPSVDYEVKLEVTVFFGLKMEPRGVVISENIAKVGFGAEFGAEIEATLPLVEKESSSEIHSCQYCLEGECSFKSSLSFEAKLFKLKYERKIRESKVKICDFYYSIDNGEFGFGICPNSKYKVVVTVKDQDGEGIENADISAPFTVKDDSFNLVSRDSITTDSKGKATGYLGRGSYILKVTKGQNELAKKEVTVYDTSKSIVIITVGSGSGEDGEKEDEKVDTKSQIFSQVSLGSNHSAAITTNGSLYTWGGNGYGGLGDGTTFNSSKPIKILDNVEMANLGGNHSAAITTDGSLYTWGYNSYGQLGDGTIAKRSKPTKMLDNVAMVNLGTYHSAAITTDDSLYTWGYNSAGQLGDGTTTYRITPTKILDNVAMVSLGYSHSAAITTDGSLYTWGYNTYGQLGDGTTTNRRTPTKILDNVAMVSLGTYHSAVITTDGSLYTWGYNDYGQLGDGTTTNRSTPKKILDNVEMVSLGYSHSAVITTDGSLYTWGDNDYGQLGDETTTNSSTPTKILNNVKMVSLGTYHSAAITTDGSLYTWGDNWSGTLGDGTTTNRSVPTKISIPSYDSDSFIVPSSIEIDNTNMEEPNATPNETSGFTDLLSNELYNIYIIKLEDSEKPMASDNLLYINQALSDQDGRINISYRLKEEYEDPVVILKGATRVDLSSASVSVPNLTYNGKEQYPSVRVTLEGKELIEGEAYEVSGDIDVTEVGGYRITITGIGDYTGSVETEFTVAKKTATTVTQVSISPSQVTIDKGGTQTFLATVTGTNSPSQSVTWKVSGNKSQNTKISENGILTVALNETANTLTVKATSTLDTGKSGTAIITVRTPAASVTNVSISPSTAVVIQGKEQTFKATVKGTNSPSQDVTWSVSGNRSKSTKINSSGKLTVAGGETAAMLTIKATSKADTKKSATVKVAVASQKGSAFTSGNYTYKVTNEKTNGSGTVQMTGLAKGKSVVTLSIPKTVKKNGITYRVTSIGAGGFRKNAKITQVTIGNNVTTIGKNAFNGCTALTKVTIGNKVTAISDYSFANCKKLKTLTIKSTKLTSVGNKSLQGISNLKIKVPSKQVSAYTKLFKGKGQKQNVTVTK